MSLGNPNGHGTWPDQIPPDTSAAVEFLRLYSGDDHIVLTAIVPNGGLVESETFRPVSDAAACAAWLDARQGVSNLYFSVNPTIRPMSGRVKAKKTDIRAMIALHVDVDPRLGEELESERERALEILSEFNPPPTFIVIAAAAIKVFGN